VVTGGTSGIGEATARRFVAEGARVVTLSIADEEVRTAGERIPGIVQALQVDVADPGQVADGFAWIDEALGGVDVLVANAGISIRHRLLDIRPEDFHRVVAVNLFGVFHCAQEAARRMTPSGGAILVTASTNGIVAHPFYAAYNASKAGVILLAKTLALELAPQIRVNCVCPGYVMTPMQEAEYTPEMLRDVDDRIPLGRHATPEEVAALFSFLASDDAAYLTGAVIPIDGGETAGGLASR
jgi:NAD(P)-dependent dehydrogenase (short-subunit alcohol dehydrogenase family)